jgi:predicted Holliday junction resolvase-like endonuclease
MEANGKRKNAENREVELRNHITELAKAEFEKFRNNELDFHRWEMDKSATAEAKFKLEQWKYQNEDDIRKDAIKRSGAVNFGKAAEHLIPFTKDFVFNPKNTRFIGSPIDLIVFDGVAEGNDRVSVFFLEVKTGKSQLSDSQKKIKSAIEAKRVFWKEIGN